MRVKPVIINKMAGRNDSAVKNSKVWMGTEKLVPPLPDPTSSGSCPAGCACAHQGNKPINASAAPANIPARLENEPRCQSARAKPLKSTPIVHRSSRRGGQGRRKTHRRRIFFFCRYGDHRETLQTGDLLGGHPQHQPGPRMG